jgi:hypothetical protein
VTRLNVEDLEGRALMSATVVAAVSAPAVDTAVVRVVETDTAAAPRVSSLELENTLISNFTQSGRESTQLRITIYDALITS